MSHIIYIGSKWCDRIFGHHGRINASTNFQQEYHNHTRKILYPIFLSLSKQTSPIGPEENIKFKWGEKEITLLSYYVSFLLGKWFSHFPFIVCTTFFLSLFTLKLLNYPYQLCQFSIRSVIWYFQVNEGRKKKVAMNKKEIWKSFLIFYYALIPD